MVGFHRRLNRETEARWDSFASHRARVTGLIAALGNEARSSTCAILGAGNCNDLDLSRLTQVFTEVHLFDIDKEAITRARDRQPPEVAARLRLRAPLDLGGALSDVGRFRRRPATPADLGALPGAGSRGVLARVADRYDVVASTCLLSQLVHGCQRLLGDDHPQIQEIACAVVVAHLRILATLTKPGGNGLLVTDVVSSDTYPLEELFGARDPWALIGELETTGNHLSGTIPTFLRRIVNTDSVVAPLIAGSGLIEPWLWRLGDEETYLVYGMALSRRAADAT